MRYLHCFISLVRSNAPQSWDDQSIEVLGSGLRGCVKFNSVRLLNFCCKIQPFLVADTYHNVPEKQYKSMMSPKALASKGEKIYGVIF